MTIETVRGPIDESELGVIAPHEHCLIDTTFEAQVPEDPEAVELFNQPVSINNIDVLRRNPFLVKDNMQVADVETCVSEVSRLNKVGVSTLVDLTNFGIDRDMAMMKEVSERTGINIIAGCGLYYSLTIGEPYRSMSVDELAAWMIDDITNGDAKTGIKPGVIGEIGVSDVIDDLENRSLRASARANLATGLPIYVHTYPWSRTSVQAAEILIEEGVRPDQICICHMDVEFNLEYINALFNLGVYVEFDDFGKEYYFPKAEAAFSGGPFATDPERVRMMIKLIEEGHTDRIIVATDVCLKCLLHKYGGWGYDHIFTNIIPMMINEGMNRKDMETILYENPKRFLCSRR